MVIQAAILAGGQGLRMRGLDPGPKALLPVKGKPLLEHQLERLKKAGFDEVILCLGYRAEDVRRRFADGARWGLRLDYRVETVPRGTAGAVRDLGIKGDLLVVYGDLYIEMDFKPLIDFHESHAGAATLVVRRTDHPQDSDLAEVAPDGRIAAIGRSGRVSGDLACAAVWVVRPRLAERAPADRPSDFGRDVFPAALAAGERLMAYRTEAVVADVGTPERYRAFSERP